MKSTLYLYRVAEKKNIPVMSFPLPENGSLCYQDDSCNCYIGIDEKILTVECEKKVHLAHELGHCVTGSFYNRHAAIDVRQQHENRADKWAIRRLISQADLDAAVADGHTDLWDLADYFGVTEDFMKKAVCFYTYGNLAADLYF